jgi:zinc transport system substrate-binding protein
MSNKIISLTSALMVGGSVAFADVPKVAVDIAPVHSLVARVMNGVGNPNLIIPAGASPHDYQLRPSEASAIQEANLIF